MTTIKFIYAMVLLILIGGCCNKVAEVERIEYPDGSFTEETIGFRYDCTGVIMIPAGKNLVKHKVATTEAKEEKVCGGTEATSAFK